MLARRHDPSARLLITVSVRSVSSPCCNVLHTALSVCMFHNLLQMHQRHARHRHPPVILSLGPSSNTSHNIVFAIVCIASYSMFRICLDQAPWSLCLDLLVYSQLFSPRSLSITVAFRRSSRRAIASSWWEALSRSESLTCCPASRPYPSPSKCVNAFQTPE